MESEAKEVGLDQESRETQAIKQLAESCAVVFELVCRSVPSNHIHTIQKEIEKVRALLKPKVEE